MKRSAWLLALAVVVALACGEQKSSPPPAVTPPAAPAPTPVPPATAPAAPAAADVPSGNLRGNADAGEKLYATYCASCHGPKGHGDGPVAQTLNPKPANHTDHVYMGSLTDQHLYQVISKGGASVGKSPMMAPWGGVINDQGIRDLIAHLRRLSNT
jgi:mono/diheme cytochrome c family protein